MERERILVVEDEEPILELLSYVLSRKGYEVTGVTTGEEALAAVRRRKPALVLLDLMLPGLSGFEVCRILKNDPEARSIPILVLTARGEADRERCRALGSDGYMTKPFSVPRLFETVRSLLPLMQF